MLVVRPVKRNDLDQLYSLAQRAKTGITTLPCDKKLLRARINESLKGFAKKVSKPKGEVYFFVMEDTIKKQLVGTSAIVSKVGVHDPFYTYEIKESVKKSNMLKVKKTIQFLQLKIIRNGPSEVGTLFLKPSVREKNCGRLMALSRYLFIAQYTKRFERNIIAELRGVINSCDLSPFWNAVCKHFFIVAYKKADLMMMKDKTFIADLIPKHPIYIPLLPISAQKVIGQVHKNTIPALKLLVKEGFKYVPEIDIFEAGPVLGAKIKEIRTVKKSKVFKVVSINNSIDQGLEYLIANVSSYKAFVVIKDRVLIRKKGIILSSNASKALNISIGQKVRVVKVKG